MSRQELRELVIGLDNEMETYLQAASRADPNIDDVRSVVETMADILRKFLIIALTTPEGKHDE